MNYYNELDPYAAQWIRNLIAKGLIPDGKVDERDIKKVKAKEVQGYTQVHMFAGIAGWSYALKLAGWPEDEEVWTGSCPCQPFSIAGKGKGKKDKRHLWPVWRELIAECKPPVIFGEQVASPLGREWLAGVRSDLEALGYEVGAADLCASCVGAPHIRQRLFWVGVSNGTRPQPRGQAGEALGYGYPPVAASSLRKLPGRRASCGQGPGDGFGGSEGASAGAIIGGRESMSGVARVITSGLADSKDSKRGRTSQTRSIRGRAFPKARRSSDSGGLVNAKSGGTMPAKQQGPLPGCQQAGSGDHRLGNASGGKLAGRKRKAAQKECSAVERANSTGASFWRNYELVHCADGKARRIESGPQQMADGFSEVLGQLRSNSTDEIERKLRDAIPDEAHAREILRDLWIILAKKAVQRTAGKIRSIYEAPVLLAIMRELARKGWKLLDHLPSACWETPEAGLRKLRQNALQASRPSYRRAVKQQYANKPADVMSVVSQAFAQAGEEAGMIPFPLAKGVLCRVGKLRAYGNAIVAPLAAEFIMAYLETRRLNHG